MCWIYVCVGNMRALLVSSSNIERLNIGKWIPSYQPPIRAETPPTSKSSQAFAMYCGILCKCKRTFKGPAYEKEATKENVCRLAPAKIFANHQMPLERVFQTFWDPMTFSQRAFQFCKSYTSLVISFVNTVFIQPQHQHLKNDLTSSICDPIPCFTYDEVQYCRSRSL